MANRRWGFIAKCLRLRAPVRLTEPPPLVQLCRPRSKPLSPDILAPIPQVRDLESSSLTKGAPLARREKITLRVPRTVRLLSLAALAAAFGFLPFPAVSLADDGEPEDVPADLEALEALV